VSSPRTVLAVGGSDPTAGAGIQADLRTLEWFGVQSATVLTAVTVQTPARVLAVEPVSESLIRDQLRAVLDSIEVHVVKVGMLPTPAAVAAVARTLDAYEVRIVVDPVMKPSGGRRLAGAGVRDALMAELLPLTACVTANLSEAAALTGKRVTELAGMKRAARSLVDLGAATAVVKGGHLSARADDVVWDGERMTVLRARRLSPGEMHGSGCAFASAMAALLARGDTPVSAARGAKRYVRALIQAAVSAGDGARLRSPPGRLTR
jgi:hydroxymethylpyrimidine/phosphomethylpyrimidine kinase